MTERIEGLHHVTSLASGAVETDRFLTGALGLRRVKTTVNFDAPDVYHLYYGTRNGEPGSVMTYFPFEGAARGRPGTGEVAETAFSVPVGSLEAWAGRLAARCVGDVSRGTRFGAARLAFPGPDGERFALVETVDGRTPHDSAGAEIAIRGFHSVTLRLAEAGPTAAVLDLLGYRETAREGAHLRMELAGGNGAGIVDIEVTGGARAVQSAGSVHHVAFAVADDAAQDRVREALTGMGLRVTPAVDRTYFRSIYFREPGGVLFEIATNGPGFAVDEDEAHLGRALKLPPQHEHLRPRLERDLVPLDP